MKFIERFKDRSPRYPTKYYTKIVHPYAYVGGGNKKNTFESGKYFSRVYEIYMYALSLGIRKSYKLPTNDVELTSFREIRYWRPVEVVDFIILSLLTKSNIDLNEIEDMEEIEVEKELTKLKKLMEEYAHGGFDLIQSEMQKDLHRFENDDFVFIDLLDEIEQEESKVEVKPKSKIMLEKSEIRTLVAQGNTNVALEKLVAYTEQEKAKDRDVFVMMLSEWNDLEKRKQQNTIKSSKARIEFSQIKSSLLQALEKLNP